MKVTKMKRKRQATKKRLVMVLAVTLALILVLGGCSVDYGAYDHGNDAVSDSYYPPDNAGSSGSSQTADSAAPGYYNNYDPYFDYSSGESYLVIEEQGELLVSRNPESTFSLKVDTASYSNVKRFVENGDLPPADAVRTEELINWFSYDEPIKFDSNSPFGFYTEIGPSPFNEDKYLAMIRVATQDIDRSDLPPSNIVFLIDVSGSMNTHDKLPLLQDSLALFIDTLDRDDRISIVTYASGTAVVLEGARGSEKELIKDTVYSLRPAGSTAGEGGIQLAYECAEENFIVGGNNRIILCSDGDFNVGISTVSELSKFISKKRDTGIYLSVLGFGTGNIRDDIMETLAKDGNGNYSYIDSLRTAEKVLVDELATNLFTVADDVKAQIVFDADAVYSYRLIGYENRLLATEDFDDDRKDAGEIGAGTDIIALYEIELVERDTEVGAHLFDVRIRYKNPGERESQLLEFPVALERMNRSSSTDFGFVSAVALYGDYLRSAANGDYSRSEQRALVDEIIYLAEANLGSDKSGYRADFVDLLHDLRFAL